MSEKKESDVIKTIVAKGKKTGITLTLHLKKPKKHGDIK